MGRNNTKGRKGKKSRTEQTARFVERGRLETGGDIVNVLGSDLICLLAEQLDTVSATRFVPHLFVCWLGD